MRKTEAERRAFLKSLKPRLVEIAAAQAERTGTIDLEELRADIAAGRKPTGNFQHTTAAPELIGRERVTR